MKVLLFAPFACSGGHHETDLEVAMRHLSQKDEIHVIYCRRELSICQPNPTHSRITCLSCFPLAKKSFKNAGLPGHSLHSLRIDPKEEMPVYNDFKTIDDLVQFEWHGIEVGRAVATSLITLDCDSSPDLNKYRYFVRESIRSFIQTYRAIERHLVDLKPDLFYVFNGRATALNAAFCAAQKKGIATMVGERDVFSKYILIPNDNGVSYQFAQRDIEHVRQSHPASIIETLGHEWFRSNREGNKQQLCNYIRQQEQGLIPKGWDKTKRNIAVFTSSEFEIVGLKGWENPLFPNQIEALKYALENLPIEDTQMYVRIHPNLWNRENTQVKELRKLSQVNLTILEPGSPVDSYALLEAATCVLTFGSTIGIEATYWGKTSISVGRSFWEKLGAAYHPESRDEMIQMLLADLPPLPQEKTLPYGAWWKLRGDQFRFVKPSNPESGERGRIEGSTIELPRWALATIRWNHRLNRLKKVIAR